MSTPLRAKSAANIDVAADISISEALPVDCTVVFQPNGRRGTVPKGTTVLEAARQLGVEIESICGGHQTCGKCKVLVEEGAFPKFGLHSLPEHLSAPGEREQRYAARYNFPPATRLSCACHLVDDVVIRVPEESQLRKQVVRKAAGVDRTITVDAPMRLYYVELPTPDLKDHRGDWERLRAELAALHGLIDLRIDLPALRACQPALAAAGRAVTVTVLHNTLPLLEAHTVAVAETNPILPVPITELGGEVIRIQPGFHDALYGIAVDVGTTTVAGHLCHLRSGEILATASRMNPQVPFGEDLMSRVSYAMMNADGVERMHRAIIDGLNELVEELCRCATTGDGPLTPTDIVEMVLVGNTTMHHLLLGIDPRELGGAPFSLATHGALDIKARDLGLQIAPGANIHIPPCEAGHVGADNVGVLVAEAPYRQDEQWLILDIGTNGEILLGNRAQMLSASSPTGPAFEGAQIHHGMRAAAGAIERVRIDPATLSVRYRIIGNEGWIESDMLAQEKTSPAPGNGAAARRTKREELLNPVLRAAGICGSGIIEAVAELFKAGLIASNGRFVEVAHPRLRSGLGEGGGKAEFIVAWPHETNNGQAIVVHSDDIRAIQLAKAALYAGAKLLLKRFGLSEVDRIVLAGGFGSYIDPLHAMILGLIPDCDLAKVQAVGNAAGDGARMILLDRTKRVEAQWAARWVHYVETAVEPTFQEEFVAAIDLPHASDPFPHLDALLAQARNQWSPERQVAFDAATGNRRQRTSQDDRAARRAARAQRRAATAESQ
ncbi:MAG TPA: ASKHA domain-containing protein [Caldilineaceae bacterium]|nr:ASKHA domain-containing protein [Caldilineaceae bacterium]